jgi:actin-related protein 2
VVDSGDGVTHAVPVVEGFSSPHLVRRLDVAGRAITAHLLELLRRRGFALDRAADLDAVRGLKEKLCFVAHDYRTEARLAQETVCRVESFRLPDGRVIRVGAERFAAPEAMFQPSLLGLDGVPGVADMVHGCIQACAIDTRRSLYAAVVVSGGSTLLPGFSTRLERDLRALYLDKVLGGDAAGLKRLKIRVLDAPGRKIMVWRGGSNLASCMAGQEAFWVSKAEWQEDPHRALKKCGSI